MNDTLVRLLMHTALPAPDPIGSREEFHRQRDTFRAHAEAARRAGLTPKQRAYEDWSRAWYRNNMYEDKEAWLNAFDAASKEGNETH